MKTFKTRLLWGTVGGLAGYSLVHIATHALIDDEQPQLSGLVLSQQDLPGEAFVFGPGSEHSLELPRRIRGVVPSLGEEVEEDVVS